MLFKSGKADCTHILTRHQEEPSYIWGKLAEKTLVSPLWLWESYEADEQLTLQDPVGHILINPPPVYLEDLQSPCFSLRPAIPMTCALECVTRAVKEILQI